MLAKIASFVDCSGYDTYFSANNNIPGGNRLRMNASRARGSCREEPLLAVRVRQQCQLVLEAGLAETNGNWRPCFVF